MTSLLRPVAIAALELDVLAPEGELREDTIDGTTSSRLVTGPVRVAFSRGPGATLAQFRTSVPGQVSFEPETDTTLCGGPARRVVATLLPPIGTGARTAPDGSLVHGAGGGSPTTFVAVSARRGESWLRAVWIVETARRAEHHADEERFFAGVRCR